MHNGHFIQWINIIRHIRAIHSQPVIYFGTFVIICKSSPCSKLCETFDKLRGINFSSWGFNSVIIVLNNALYLVLVYGSANAKHSPLQSQNTVTFHLKSKQLLPFGFVRQHTYWYIDPCMQEISQTWLGENGFVKKYTIKKLSKAPTQQTRYINPMLVQYWFPMLVQYWFPMLVQYWTIIVLMYRVCCAPM